MAQDAPDDWVQGQINPLHRAVWLTKQDEDRRAAAVQTVLDDYTVVKLDRLNLAMPFE